MELSIKNELNSGALYIYKMANKVKEDMKNNNLTKMPLSKIVKRFNKNVSLKNQYIKILALPLLFGLYNIN